MSGYNLNNQQAGSYQALASTYKTITRVVAAASAPRRIRYEEMEWSAVSVPNSTDCQVQADLTYCGATGAGTGTAATPQPQDSGAAIGTAIDVCVATGLVNCSAEPTTYVQANCWYNRGFNQRSGVLWQSSPGFQIILPATLSTGAGMRALSTNYTGNVVARAIFSEL
jgi:hypothetical protein